MIERRYAPTEFEVRQHESGGAVIEGHAAVFNRLSHNLGGFVEQIAPSAFDQTLGDNPDVRALINHDPSLLLGRTRSGTLRLAKDNLGLHYEVDVPDRGDARDLIVSMERGDIDQSSFAFWVLEDEWGTTEDDFARRTLTAVSIHNGDVSPVTYPAYDATDSGIADRAFQSLAEVRSLDLEQVRQAATDGGLTRFIVGEQAEDSELRETRSALAVARARLGLVKHS